MTPIMKKMITSIYMGRLIQGCLSLGKANSSVDMNGEASISGWAACVCIGMQVEILWCTVQLMLSLSRSVQ